MGAVDSPSACVNVSDILSILSCIDDQQPSYVLVRMRAISLLSMRSRTYEVKVEGLLRVTN